MISSKKKMAADGNHTSRVENMKRDRQKCRKNRQPIMGEADRHMEQIVKLSGEIKQVAPVASQIADRLIEETKAHCKKTYDLFYEALHQLAHNLRSRVHNRKLKFGSFAGGIALLFLIFTSTLEPRTALEYFKAVGRLSRSCQFEKAARMNARGLSQFPKSVELLVQRAALYETMGEHENALFVLENAHSVILANPDWQETAESIRVRCKVANYQRKKGRIT